MNFRIACGALSAALTLRPRRPPRPPTCSTPPCRDAGAAPRTCEAKPASGTGVVQRTVTASANGLVSGRLSGQGSGDWDLAIFDKLTGKRVAASSSFGLTELAEGIAAKGQMLTVQACRRSGSASPARADRRSIPLAAPTGEKIQLVRVALPTDASRAALDATGLDQTEHARAVHPGRAAATAPATRSKLTQRRPRLPGDHARRRRGRPRRAHRRRARRTSSRCRAAARATAAWPTTRTT